MNPSISFELSKSKAMVIQIHSDYNDTITIIIKGLVLLWYYYGIIKGLVTPWIENETINELLDLTQGNETNVNRYFEDVVCTDQRTRDEKENMKNPTEIPALACLISNRQLNYPSVQCMLRRNRTHNITIIVLAKEPLSVPQNRVLRGQVDLKLKF